MGTSESGNGYVDDITPSGIKVVTLDNIEKFFADHPEYREQQITVLEQLAAFRQEERRNFKITPRVTPRGGLMNRETVAMLMGELSEELFEEIAKSKEHISMVFENYNDWSSSLK